MIIASNRKHKVGKLVTSPYKDTFKQIKQRVTFFIGREATRDEWVADIEANGGETPILSYPYYYEVAD